jgi:hypothetical protein
MPDRPVIDVNQVIAEAESAVRDGAYVAVGLGVLAFQRAQVQRRELTRRIEQRRAGLGADGGPAIDRFVSQLGDATLTLSNRLDEVGRSLTVNADATRAQLQELVRTVDTAMAPARRQLEIQVEAFESRLPSPAREVVAGVRSAAAAPEARLRAAVGLD